MKKRILTILLVLASLLLLVVLMCVVSALYSAKTFIVTNYELTAPLQKPLRIVQLSDLHGRQYGKENQRLIDRVRELGPDMIFMTGDMLRDGETDQEPLMELIGKMKDLAPVYYCYGNQEQSWMKSTGIDLRPLLEKAGATVLEAEYLDLERDGDAIRIGGYAGYYHTPHMYSVSEEQRAAEIRFTEDFEDTDAYKILLNHIPTNWLDWDYRNTYDVDLVLCGHYHGGLIRYPWGGALYAPYVGRNPPYTKGLFVGEKATVVLSTGLGAQPGYPRINNPGEIVCLDLLPEK